MQPQLLRTIEDLGVDHDQRGLGRIVLGRVHDDQAPGDADLRRGEPDAGRLVHCGQHIVHEPAKLGVDALDRLRTLAQEPVGNGENRADGHLKG